MIKPPEEIEYENARLAHAAEIKGMEIENNMVANFANAAIRAPGVAAAGGIVALLGFYSANSNIIRGTSSLEDFNSALICFFASVVACVTSPGAAYFSQMLFVRSRAKRGHHFKRPFVRNTKLSIILFTIATFFQILTIALTVLSIVLLVKGGFYFYYVAEFSGSAPM